jgi:transcriptional regulator with XRE-family HTH domain
VSLRAARKAVGLTRAQLAGLTGCSVASLGWIEAGAVPKRSAVLERALAVIDELQNKNAPGGEPDALSKLSEEKRDAHHEIYTVE